MLNFLSADCIFGIWQLVLVKPKVSFWNTAMVVSSEKRLGMNTTSFWNVAHIFEMLMSPTAIFLWYKKALILFAEKHVISIEFSEKICNLKINLSSCAELIYQQNPSGVYEETKNTDLAEA